MSNRPKKYNSEEWKDRIIEAINSSITMTEAYKKLGLERKTFKRMAEELGLYQPNQAGKGMNKKHDKIPLSDILENKVPFQSHKLKLRLLDEKVFEYKCCRCNLSTWLDKPIPLELHHKNGKHTDNSLENLELLCPNCHALTDTYRSKNLSSNKEKKKESDINEYF